MTTNRLANHWGTSLMLALTVVTGVVDAVGYLALDRVFTGNMTGNIVILGMGAAGADELPVLGPAIALVTFTIAAWVTGILLRNTTGWTTRITFLLATEGVLLAFVAGIAALLNDPLPARFQVPAAAAIAALMGLQAVAARTLAISDLTTVVVTSTLVAIASESLMTMHRHALLNRRVGAVVSVLAGATIGAALLAFARIEAALGLAAVITVVVACVGHWKFKNTCRSSRAVRTLGVTSTHTPDLAHSQEKT